MEKGKQAKTDLGRALQELIKAGEEMIEAVKKFQEVSQGVGRVTKKGEPPPEEMVK